MTINALSNVNGKWIGDESNGELNLDGTVLTLKSSSPGTPFNARYDCITPPDDQDWYFQVKLDSISKNSSVSVGVVNPEEMLPGWKTRGMFYNGNLTNGAAALVTSFGPYLKQGDCVGVLVSNKNQNVTFYINEKCLGTGFSLGQEDSGKVFCPCIHVSGEATVSFVIPDTLPSSVVTREKTTQGMTDEWKLIQAINETGAVVNVPESRDIVLHLEDGEEQYDLSIRVGNTLRCRAKKEVGGGVTVGRAMSTMMEPPPELREMETFVSTCLPTVTNIDLLDQNLVLTSSGSQTKLVFERYVKSIKPLETYTN